jgi:hypothetical protein
MKPIISAYAKNLSDEFPIQNCLKQGNGLLALLFNFFLEYETRKVHKIQKGLELNRKHQFLVFVDDVNILDKNISTIRKDTSLLEANREIGL